MRISSDRFRFMIVSAVLLTIGATIAGCSSLQQAIQGYGTIAVTGAHAAADTVVEAQKVSMCDLPYSAIQRHPDIQPAVQSLCGPLPVTK